jgi:hypothetical protein
MIKITIEGGSFMIADHIQELLTKLEKKSIIRLNEDTMTIKELEKLGYNATITIKD